jgi:cation-transporting P-type ATPase 13A2
MLGLRYTKQLQALNMMITLTPVLRQPARRAIHLEYVMLEVLEDPLLSRQESFKPFYSRQRAEHRLAQRIYIVTEDLTAVISGFSTSFSGLCIYILLCTLSFGTAYLVFRWLPKWRVRLIGSPTPLRQCQWVAIEVSNAFAILKITWS